MSLPDIFQDKPTKEELEYTSKCEREADEFAARIKKETGYDINGTPGVGLYLRCQFMKPDEWPDYAAKVLETVKSGKRGKELADALFYVEMKYSIMI